MFLICSLHVLILTLASPLAEPEPEPEAEADSSSLGGFYTPVYYPSQLGQYPGYTYRFGPPLPPLQEQASDLSGDTFRSAFKRAFNQYITSGLLNNYRSGVEHSHLGENRDDLDFEESNSKLSEDGDMEEVEEMEYPDYDEDERESSFPNKDKLPVIEILK